MSPEIIAVIDIGTTKVCTLIAKPSCEYSIQILGVCQVPSIGLHKGIVVNPDAARKTIAESIARAEKASGVRVESAFVGFAARIFYSLCVYGLVASLMPRGGRLVRSRDLKRTLEHAYQITIPGTLHAKPRQKVPVSTAAMTTVENLVECVRNTDIEIDDLIAEPLAASEAVLRPEEKESGVVLVDIGGSYTDIAIFKRGAIYHISSLPVASGQLISDVSISFGLPFDIAENTIKKYGNMASEFSPGNNDIAIDAEDDNRHNVFCYELRKVIRDRLAELLRLILLELPSSDYVSLAPAGLVS
mgnify:CR=1 FL=1